MKKFLFFGLLSLMVASCDKNSSQHENTSSASIDKSKIQLAIDTDPVCNMSVKENVADTTTYKGKVYGFCNPGCKDEFKKDPEKYLK